MKGEKKRKLTQEQKEKNITIHSKQTRYRKQKKNQKKLELKREAEWEKRTGKVKGEKQQYIEFYTS